MNLSIEYGQDCEKDYIFPKELSFIGLEINAEEIFNVMAKEDDSDRLRYGNKDRVKYHNLIRCKSNDKLVEVLTDENKKLYIGELNKSLTELSSQLKVKEEYLETKKLNNLVKLNVLGKLGLSGIDINLDNYEGNNSELLKMYSLVDVLISDDNVNFYIVSIDVLDLYRLYRYNVKLDYNVKFYKEFGNKNNKLKVIDIDSGEYKYILAYKEFKIKLLDKDNYKTIDIDTLKDVNKFLDENKMYGLRIESEDRNNKGYRYYHYKVIVKIKDKLYIINDNKFSPFNFSHNVKSGEVKSELYEDVKYNQYFYWLSSQDLFDAYLNLIFNLDDNLICNYSYIKDKYKVVNIIPFISSFDFEDRPVLDDFNIKDYAYFSDEFTEEFINSNDLGLYKISIIDFGLNLNNEISKIIYDFMTHKGDD